MSMAHGTADPAAQGVGVTEAHLGTHFGRDTMAMLHALFGDQVERGVLLMRHSARTFDRSINDLENRLTPHGRALCEQFGRGLPKDLHMRGYASPPHRCVETAELILKAHAEAGGEAGRTRPVEALGVFYALDQQKMWKGLSAADGLADYVGRWFAGEVPADAMMPAELAVDMLLRVLKAKLAQRETRGVDVCVTHDMTVYTLRHGAGLEPVDGPPVEFLDGLLLYEHDGQAWLRSQHGAEVHLGAVASSA